MDAGDARSSSKGSDAGFTAEHGERTLPSTAPAKADGGEPQDVFLLTGTTFAGATDMNSTAGPDETRPSTEATRIGTRPGSVLPVVRIGEGVLAGNVREDAGDGGSASSTERHNRLLIEAELRAGHQAAARETMLDLASALDTSNNRARELAALLRAEYEASRSIREERDRLEAEVLALVEKDEKRLADVLTEKALASGNKMFFGMLIEKSREAYEFSTFGPTAELKETPDVFGAVGDRVTASWAVKLWFREVELTKARKAKERAEAERLRKLEEERRRIEEEKERAVEEVRKMVRELEAQLERARKMLEEQSATQHRIERELALEREAAARAQAEAIAKEEKLKADLAATQKSLSEVQEALATLQEEYEQSQEALKNANQAFDAERAQLRSIIRQVSSELHEAMVLAKHMRETALKAKRDAAGSVSPSKFAELIAQLEEMKSQLSVLNKDCVHEHDTNSWLLRQLDKNKRQLELERQFLPLLRKVRGPIGPKVSGQKEEGAKKKDMTQQALQAPQKTMPPLTNGMSPKHRSQSMSALDGGRAATAGGPLAGSRSGGLSFSDDQTRFASSLGFANSTGQGTPMRG